jgi:hypothetical protein
MALSGSSQNRCPDSAFAKRSSAGSFEFVLGFERRTWQKACSNAAVIGTGLVPVSGAGSRGPGKATDQRANRHRPAGTKTTRQSLLRNALETLCLIVGEFPSARIVGRISDR